MRPLLLALALLLAAAPVHAQTTYTALSGSLTVPASGSGAVGRVTATLTGDQLTVSGWYRLLSGTPTAAHVHGPADAGSNGPVLFALTLTSSAGTSGAWLENANTFTLTPAQQADFAAGRLYVDVHTSAVPGGELRAQLRDRGNDDVASAYPLSPGTPLAMRTATTVNATADPRVAEPDASCQAQANDQSVWWVVRSNSSPATIMLDTFGSTFDTVLSVYTFNGTTFTEVACNDDAALLTQSRIENLTLATGFAYFVRVSGYQAEAGRVQLAMTSNTAFAPGNNSWRPGASFGTYLFGAGLVLDSNVGANAVIAGEPTAPASCAPVPGSNAVWRVYRSQQTGYVTLDTFGSTFDTILMVTDFDGNVLACNDDTATPLASSRSQLLNVPVTANEQYYVRVASYNPATTGLVRLEAQFSPQPVAAEAGPAAGPTTARLRLDPAQPNPTAGATTLAFTLDAAGPARLSVLDLLGREVAVPFDGAAPAGETAVGWDARALPAGVYVVRLAAGGAVATRRVTVAR